MKTLIALLILAISTNTFASCSAAHNRHIREHKINYPVYLSDTEELKKLPPEDREGLKRAAGKCYQNVRLVAPHKVEGDWVCAPPRAATPEEQRSKTEK